MIETTDRCVVLFTRAPSEEGSRKRLSQAVSLFELSRDRVARAVAELPGVALVVVGGGTAAPGVTRLRQRGATFAERLRNAFRDARGLGYQNVVVVPADVPGLSREELEQAFAALSRGEVAIGPSPDGGVYLLGLAADPGSSLDGVRWQTSRVAQDLVDHLSPGEPIHLLRPLADVDRHADLRALQSSAPDAQLAALLHTLLATRETPASQVRPPAPRIRVQARGSRGPPQILAA